MQDLKFKWVAKAVTMWHKTSSALQSPNAAAASSKQADLWSTVVSQILHACVPATSQDHDMSAGNTERESATKAVLAVHAAPLRSHMFLVLLETTPQGRLKLLLDDKGCVQFTSSKSVFESCYDICHKQVGAAAAVMHATAARVLYAGNGCLAWLADSEQLPVLQDVQDDLSTGAGNPPGSSSSSADTGHGFWRCFNHESHDSLALALPEGAAGTNCMKLNAARGAEVAVDNEDCKHVATWSP